MSTALWNSCNPDWRLSTDNCLIPCSRKKVGAQSILASCVLRKRRTCLLRLSIAPDYIFGCRIDNALKQKLMQRTVLRTTEQLLGSEELFFFSFGQGKVREAFP